MGGRGKTVYCHILRHNTFKEYFSKKKSGKERKNKRTIQNLRMRRGGGYARTVHENNSTVKRRMVIVTCHYTFG